MVLRPLRISIPLMHGRSIIYSTWQEESCDHRDWLCFISYQTHCILLCELYLKLSSDEMGTGAALNETDQRPGVWGLQIMSHVHISYKQWAKTVPEKEETHLFRLLYGCVTKQMLATFPHPSSL